MRRRDYAAEIPIDVGLIRTEKVIGNRRSRKKVSQQSDAQKGSHASLLWFHHWVELRKWKRGFSVAEVVRAREHGINPGQLAAPCCSCVYYRGVSDLGRPVYRLDYDGTVIHLNNKTIVHIILRQRGVVIVTSKGPGRYGGTGMNGPFHNVSITVTVFPTTSLGSAGMKSSV